MLYDMQIFEEVDGAEIQAAPDFCFSAVQRPRASTGSRNGGLSGQARIKTLTGEKKIRDLKPGDQVLTRDNGFQAVCWVGELSQNKSEERMVLVKADAFAPGLPSADLMLSPHQQVLTNCGALRAFCDGQETLVRARELTHVDQDMVEEGRADCWHILLERHEVILANDIWTESFQPDRRFVENASKSVQQKLEHLCPCLSKAGNQRAFPAARSQTRLWARDFLQEVQSSGVSRSVSA